MRMFRQMLAAMIIAMLSVPKAVFEGGKWILRAVFAPAMPQGTEIEEALDAVRAAAAPTPSATPADTVQAEEAVRVAAPFKSLTPSETEEALTAWGCTARAYAVSRLSSGPEPDMRSLDESAEGWLRGLSDQECMRLLDFGARQVSDHMTGSHFIAGLPRCIVRPSWMQPIVLADVENSELVEAVRADLARDPSLVPGYRVAA